MAKEVSGLIKLQIKGGAANPSPPVGPALGAKGVNIMEFCKQFNARTQDKAGRIVPAVITVYADKSFDFVIKTAPAPIQLLDAAKVKSGSPEPNRKKVASVTWDQVRVIAEDKMTETVSLIDSGIEIERTYIDEADVIRTWELDKNSKRKTQKVTRLAGWHVPFKI